MSNRPTKRKNPPERSEGHLAVQTNFQGAGRQDGPQPVVPTPELQELFNTMRRLEEQLEGAVDLSERLRLQNAAAGNDEHDAYLHPPSPSQATTSPRSPASTTRSVTHGFDNLGVDDEEHPSKKPRARRNKPLEAFNKAKAAFMRKIGACPGCRARRVSCNHFDRAAFEQQYQAQKRRERGFSSVDQLHETPRVPNQANLTAPATTTWIGGAGGWQHQTSPLPPSGGLNEELAELENSLGQTPSTSTSTAPYYHSTIPNRASATYFPSPNPVLQYSTPPALSSNIQMAGQSAQVPIGRTLDNINWECKHGEDFSASNNMFGVCGLLFGSYTELLRHFESEHFTLSSIPWSMWKCTFPRASGPCGFYEPVGYPEPVAPARCVHCNGSRWERWWFANIARTPSLTSEPSLPLSSRDGSGMGGYYPNTPQYPGSSYGDQTNFNLLWPGRGWGGNQSGSHHSFNTRSVRSKSKDACFRRTKVYHRGCPYGRKCRTLIPPFVTLAKGPLLLISTTLLVILVEQWLVASAPLMKTKQVAMSAFDAVRSHIDIFWMSLLCLVIGLVGMWLFKHVKLRTGPDIANESCHRRCPVRDYFGVCRQLDLEDTGSIGDDEMSQAPEDELEQRPRVVVVG